MTLARRLVAEGGGTALLVAVVIGSGIMARNLSGGRAALALLANAIASGVGLVASILMFGGVSGAHFNPVVTLSAAWQGGRYAGRQRDQRASRAISMTAETISPPTTINLPRTIMTRPRASGSERYSISLFIACPCAIKYSIHMLTVHA